MCRAHVAHVLAQGQGHSFKVKYLTNKYYTLCHVRSITPLLMEGFPLNLNDTFTSTRGCAEPMFPRHVSAQGQGHS